MSMLNKRVKLKLVMYSLMMYQNWAPFKVSFLHHLAMSMYPPVDACLLSIIECMHVDCTAFVETFAFSGAITSEISSHVFVS